MTEEEKNCPICFEEYGEREDGTFLYQEGKDNSTFADKCKHYFCDKCIKKFSKCDCGCGKIKKTGCPLCREDWTEYIYYLRYFEMEEEEESESESESEN